MPPSGFRSEPHNRGSILPHHGRTPARDPPAIAMPQPYGRSPLTSPPESHFFTARRRSACRPYGGLANAVGESPPRPIEGISSLVVLQAPSEVAVRGDASLEPLGDDPVELAVKPVSLLDHAPIGIGDLQALARRSRVGPHVVEVAPAE